MRGAVRVVPLAAPEFVTSRLLAVRLYPTPNIERQTERVLHVLRATLLVPNTSHVPLLGSPDFEEEVGGPGAPLTELAAAFHATYGVPLDAGAGGRATVADLLRDMSAAVRVLVRWSTDGVHAELVAVPRTPAARAAIELARATDAALRARTSAAEATSPAASSDSEADSNERPVAAAAAVVAGVTLEELGAQYAAMYGRPLSLDSLGPTPLQVRWPCMMVPWTDARVLVI
jgi:hypothetical protein